MCESNNPCEIYPIRYNPEYTSLIESKEEKPFEKDSVVHIPLIETTYKNTPSFNQVVGEYLPEGFYYGKVVKVYDGDTIWVAINTVIGQVRIKLRFGNINTPEISRCTYEEKERGLLSKKIVYDLIQGEMIYFSMMKGVGKFNRKIGEIFPKRETWKKYIPCDEKYNILLKELGGHDKNLNLNNYLLYKGFAVIYQD